MRVSIGCIVIGEVVVGLNVLPHELFEPACVDGRRHTAHCHPVLALLEAELKRLLEPIREMRSYNKLL